MAARRRARARSCGFLAVSRWFWPSGGCGKSWPPRRGSARVTQLRRRRGFCAIRRQGLGGSVFLGDGAVHWHRARGRVLAPCGGESRAARRANSTKYICICQYLNLFSDIPATARTGKRGPAPFVRSTLRAVPANGACPLCPGPNNKRAEGPDVPLAKGNALVIRAPRADNQSPWRRPSRSYPLPTWAFDDNTRRLTRADRRARANAAPSSELPCAFSTPAAA